MKRLITHIKRWNKWRKLCGNGWFHKLSVLFGGHSPTFEFTFTNEELADFQRGLERGPNLDEVTE